MTRDPIGYAGGLNLYGFVGNDPIDLRDPLGLMVWYDRWIQNAANFSAGFGDFITGDLTSQFREQFGLNDNVNECSKSYEVGEWTGLAWDVAFLVAVPAEAAGYGIEFVGHGGRAWHVGIDLAGGAGGRNLIHLGRHVEYGIHLGIGYTAPFAARVHYYFESLSPLIIRRFPPK